jgi:hypothetical protein
MGGFGAPMSDGVVSLIQDNREEMGVAQGDGQSDE